MSSANGLISQHKDRSQSYRSGPIRFFLLFLLSMVVLGTQYAFNNPQALEKSIEQDLGIGQTAFNLLYTIFSLPNIVATLIIGYFIDYLGVRIGLIALASGVALSQGIIAIGGYIYSYNLILIGRALFGLTSESLIIAQASMVSFWFKGRQLAFALGIAVTFPELGNALNSWLSPLIYESSGSLGTPFLVSVFFCILSLLCALMASYLDKKADLVIFSLFLVRCRSKV